MSYDARLPPRRSLGRMGTPFERLERTGARLGIDLWVKRDDLTGSALSGNKVRKLEFLVADALREGAETLVTCGGVNSNHARATAIAAARAGMTSHLLLRGEDRKPAMGNLLLDRFVGAEVSFVDAEGYAERNQRMLALAETCRGYVIPEGGSNALGSLGYLLAAEELAADAAAAGVRIGRVVHALGSGGTTAGLAMGLARCGLQTDLVAVAVQHDGVHFDRVIRGICDDAVRQGWVDPEVGAKASWRVLDGFIGDGYACPSADEMRLYRELAAEEGIVVDPVYSGKAFSAIMPGGLPEVEGATVFVHTGGIFELFAYPDLVKV